MGSSSFWPSRVCPRHQARPWSWQDYGVPNLWLLIITHPWCVDFRSRDALLHQGHPRSSSLTSQFGGSRFLTPVLLLMLLAQLGMPPFPSSVFPKSALISGRLHSNINPSICLLWVSGRKKWPRPLRAPAARVSFSRPVFIPSLLPISDLFYCYAQMWGLWPLCFSAESSMVPRAQWALTVCFRSENCCCHILSPNCIEKQLQVVLDLQGTVFSLRSHHGSVRREDTVLTSRLCVSVNSHCAKRALPIHLNKKCIT